MPHTGEVLNHSERKQQPTPADVENSIQAIITSAQNHQLDSATALEQLEAANDQILTFPNMLPQEIAMSHLRQRAVGAEARAHITALANGSPEFGMMRWDTADYIKGAKGLWSKTPTSTISFDSLPTLADFYHLHPVQRNVILGAIDHRLLGFKLDALETSVRKNEWAEILKTPLSIEPPVEPEPVLSPSEQHQQAVEFFEAAVNQLDGSKEAQQDNLREAQRAAGKALREYGMNPDADVMQAAACRFLYAQILHDLTTVGVFADRPDAGLSAKLFAIELMWETTEELLQKEAKFHDFLDRPERLKTYGENELINNPAASRGVWVMADNAHQRVSCISLKFLPWFFTYFSTTAQLPPVPTVAA